LKKRTAEERAEAVFLLLVMVMEEEDDETFACPRGILPFPCESGKKLICLFTALKRLLLLQVQIFPSERVGLFQNFIIQDLSASACSV
jgi:hypothetical protein